MATLNDTLKEALKAQAVLKDAVLDQLAEVQLFLSAEPEAKVYDRLTAKRTELMDQFDALQIQGIALLGVTSEQDLATIQEASKKIKEFVYNTKKVEKTITVITAVIVFVGAALSGKPMAITDAAIALYNTMNKKIEEESAKGENAAVMMTPFSMTGMKARAMKKVVPAKAAAKPAAKTSAAKKPASKPAAKTTPAAKTVATKPEAKKPAAKKPAASKPGAKPVTKPAAKKPVAKKPAK